MLRCRICNESESTPDVSNLIYVVSDLSQNSLSWCVSGDAFVSRCHYVDLGQYTTDFSSGAYVHAVDISADSMRLHVDEISKTYVIPLDASNSRIGLYDMSFTELYYTSEMESSQPPPPSDISDTNYKKWAFVDSSFSVTMRWYADGSSSTLYSHMDDSMIRVEKTRNDAACDNIQISDGYGTIPDVNALGLSNSSVDTVINEMNYADRYEAEMSSTNMLVSNMENVVHLNIEDSAFSSGVNELIEVGGFEAPTDTSGLRAVLRDLMLGGWLCGLRSDTDVSFSCQVRLSNIDFSDVPIFTVTPQLYLHSTV